MPRMVGTLAVLLWTTFAGAEGSVRVRVASLGSLVETQSIQSFQLEEYVAGVLASEMPLSFPLEALKAQAVAARSYVVAKRSGRMGQSFDVESTILDQAFHPRWADKLPANYVRKVLRAIRETRGQLLIDKSGKVALAQYHSDCGGITESADQVWDGGRKTASVRDVQCAQNHRHDWSYSLSRPDIREIEIVSYTPSGRVGELLVMTDAGERAMSANEFRLFIGPTKIRSARFTLRRRGNSFVFQGRGFGHGVGLCQWGSKDLARRGLDYRKILKAFYPEYGLSYDAVMTRNRKNATELKANI